MTQKTKVLIADDHPVVRQGLRAVLSTQPNLQIIGEAEDGEVAVAFARSRRPDVVLMDVAMPVCNGEKATRRILRLLPKCKVLALSTYTDDHSVQQMLQAGVVGYLTKQSGPYELITAVRAITAGKAPFFSRDIAATARKLHQTCCTGFPAQQPLSSRERQVLKLVTSGLTSRSIAAQLELSLLEVRACRERVMNKLKACNVADLTRYAVANGFIALDARPGPSPNPEGPGQPVPLLSNIGANNHRAYLLDEPTPGKLLQAIEGTVCSGEDCAIGSSPQSQPQALRFLERADASSVSDREREVIIAIAQGLTNKETAVRLRVGVRTIETHRENLRRKLKIKDGAGITKFAMANGWVSVLGQNLGEPSCDPANRVWNQVARLKAA